VLLGIRATPLHWGHFKFQPVPIVGGQAPWILAPPLLCLVVLVGVAMRVPTESVWDTGPHRCASQTATIATALVQITSEPTESTARRPPFQVSFADVCLVVNSLSNVSQHRQGLSNQPMQRMSVKHKIERGEKAESLKTN
jgi:hypothetical protein